MLASTRLVINKVTTGCNCACKYCGSNALLNSGSKMDLATFRTSVDYVLNLSNQRHLTWLFQGGEPLTMGIDWYQEAIPYARLAAEKKNVQIDFGMTTNGVLLEEDTVEFLCREGVIIGVSMDGPPHINDAFRTHGTRTLAGIRRLQKKGKSFRVVCMTTPANWNRMKEIIAFFLNEGIHYARVNLYYMAGRGNNCTLVTPDQGFEAKKACLQWMLTHEDSFTEINIIHQVLRYFGHHPLSLGAVCSTVHCGGGNGFLGITHDGTIYPCGRASDIGYDFALGNVQAPLSATNVAQTLNRFHAMGSLLGACVTCPAVDICDFGCVIYGKANRQNWDLDCGVMKLLFQYLHVLSEDDKQKLLLRMETAHKRLPKELGN